VRTTGNQPSGSTKPCVGTATSIFNDAPLFMALTRAAERRIGDFNAQHLANTAWALAVARPGQSNALLFIFQSQQVW
jgi:hypothetical protein